MNTIFRKLIFQCGGCGRTQEVKLQVPPEARSNMIRPPPGWIDASQTGQDPRTGHIGSLVVFACSQECLERIPLGQGPGYKALSDFKALMLGGVLNNADVQIASVGLEQPKVPDGGEQP